MVELEESFNVRGGSKNEMTCNDSNSNSMKRMDHLALALVMYRSKGGE